MQYGLSRSWVTEENGALQQRELSCGMGWLHVCARTCVCSKKSRLQAAAQVRPRGHRKDLMILWPISPKYLTAPLQRGTAWLVATQGKMLYFNKRARSPTAMGHTPAATSAADPELDAPVCRSTSCGLRAVPARQPSTGVGFVLLRCAHSFSGLCGHMYSQWFCWGTCTLIRYMSHTTERPPLKEPRRHVKWRYAVTRLG